MAGSGFRPLTNIPYCCLPQESGPCLSTSVGDRPLRSPTHRRLGGPSPRQQANGTHARPVPLSLCHAGDAPCAAHGALPGVSTGYAPGRGGLHTRCAPVRHSRPPEGGLPSDLHVLGLPLAFILSQDQTLRCTIALTCFSLNLGFRLDVLFGVPSKRFLLPCGAPSPQVLCWTQTFKELQLLPLITFLTTLFWAKRIAKVRQFLLLAIKNFNYF